MKCEHVLQTKLVVKELTVQCCKDRDCRQPPIWHSASAESRSPGEAYPTTTNIYTVNKGTWGAIWADSTNHAKGRFCPHRTHYRCNLAGHIMFFFLWEIHPDFAQTISVDILHGYEFRSMGAAISVDGWSGYVEISVPLTV